MLNKHIKTYIIHFVFVNLKSKVLIYSFWKAEIIFLSIKKEFKSILVKYSDFINIFLIKFVTKLFKYLTINTYNFNLKIDKQIAYILFYSFKNIELKTFKTYIKSNLASSFIWSSRSLA